MPQFQRVFDEAASPRRADLLWREEMPAMILQEHDRRRRSAPVDLIELRDAVYGGLGLFRGKAGLWHEPGIAPVYVEFLLGRMKPDNPVYGKWTSGLFAEPQTIVALDGPALVPIHPNWIFGHFLLEMLPRALLLDQTCPPDWPMLVSGSGPAWLIDLLRKAVPHRTLHLFRHESEVVTAPRFVGCSDLISETTIRPEAKVLILMLKARMLAAGQCKESKGLPRSPQKIFLSRKGISNRRRVIENQDEIEAAVEAAGYTVVQPEALAFEDQVNLFDKARIVVGEFSSAIHNAIFSPAGTRVVCLNWLNGYQSQIAALFGHTVGYIPPDDGIFRDTSSLRKGEGKLRFDVTRVMDRLKQVEDMN